MYDGSHYHAISLQKYRRDAYDSVNKTMTGKVLLDVPLGIQSARNAAQAIAYLADKYDALVLNNFEPIETSSEDDDDEDQEDQ